MARPPLDLGRETDGCAGRWHGTEYAVRRGGCTCPTAVATHQERKRRWRRAWCERNGIQVGRRTDVDQTAVEHAIDGYIDAKRLTTAERVHVVRHLTTIRHMTDRDIALHLRWSPDPILGRNCVLRFRSNHRIPAGVPATHGRPLRELIAT